MSSQVLRVSWEPQGDGGYPVTTCKLSWESESSGSGKETVPVSVTEFDITALSNDKAYTVTVIAVNEAGPGMAAIRVVSPRAALRLRLRILLEGALQ